MFLQIYNNSMFQWNLFSFVIKCISFLKYLGEGSKPLFHRDDIKVGQPSAGESHANVSSRNYNDGFNSKQNRRSTSNVSKFGLIVDFRYSNAIFKRVFYFK